MSTTKHTKNCKRAWANYDLTCPRCQELANGASARKGWGWRKKHNEALERRWRKEHDCKKAGCGPVCTAFDW